MSWRPQAGRRGSCERERHCQERDVGGEVLGRGDAGGRRGAPVWMERSERVEGDEDADEGGKARTARMSPVRVWCQHAYVRSVKCRDRVGTLRVPSDAADLARRLGLCLALEAEPSKLARRRWRRRWRRGPLPDAVGRCACAVQGEFRVWGVGWGGEGAQVDVDGAERVSLQGVCDWERLCRDEWEPALHLSTARRRMTRLSDSEGDEDSRCPPGGAATARGRAWLGVSVDPAMNGRLVSLYARLDLIEDERGGRATPARLRSRSCTTSPRLQQTQNSTSSPTTLE